VEFAWKAPAPKVGDVAPELGVRTLDGDELRLRDLRGRVVLLEFWATWCPGCRAFAPVFRRLDRDYRSSGLEIIGVDQAEPAELVREYRNEYNLHFSEVIDDGPLAGQYGIVGVPSYVLIDRTGRIAAAGRSIEAEPVLRGHIESALGSGAVNRGRGPR
jgi:peroxiredoxin